MVTPLEQPATEATQPLVEPSVEVYRRVIIQFLSEQSRTAPKDNRIDQQVVIDQEHDHYLLVRAGWNHDETKREYLVLFHLDIVDSKIWVQQNSTELLIERVLVERGVTTEDIVLGTLPTFSRQHSGYGVR